MEEAQRLKDELESARALQTPDAAEMQQLARLPSFGPGNEHRVTSPTHSPAPQVSQLAEARHEREATKERLARAEAEMDELRVREAGLKADLLALQDDRSTSMAPSAQPPPGGSAEQAKRGLGGFGSKFAQLKSQAEAKLKEAQQKK